MSVHSAVLMAALAMGAPPGYVNTAEGAGVPYSAAERTAEDSMSFYVQEPSFEEALRDIFPESPELLEHLYAVAKVGVRTNQYVVLHMTNFGEPELSLYRGRADAVAEEVDRLLSGGDHEAAYELLVLRRNIRGDYINDRGELGRLGGEDDKYSRSFGGAEEAEDAETEWLREALEVLR